MFIRNTARDHNYFYCMVESFVPFPAVIPGIAASVLMLFSESTYHANGFYRGFNIG